jgi:hypothetical protein
MGGPSEIGIGTRFGKSMVVPLHPLRTGIVQRLERRIERYDAVKDTLLISSLHEFQRSHEHEIGVGH